MSVEIWKNIPEYEGYYVINNQGQVKSLDRVIKRKDNKKYSIKGKVMIPKLDRYGYLYIKLSKDGIRKHYNIHRLVGLTFIKNPKRLPCINHINENKLDNSVENLEWCTVKYNNDYGTRKGKVSMKLSKPVQQFDLKGNLIKEYPSLISTSEFGFNPAHISNCCREIKDFNTHKGFIWKYKNN